jgi:hypothetical protein
METAFVRMSASSVKNIAKTQRRLLKSILYHGGNSNFLLLMDTHSDYETGWLAHATRIRDGAQFVDAASGVS